MLLQNKAKRLISINTKMKTQLSEDGKAVIKAEQGKVYDLLPAGEPVDVPKKYAETKYVKALIKCGDVIEVAAPAKAEDKAEDKDETVTPPTDKK